MFRLASMASCIWYLRLRYHRKYVLLNLQPADVTDFYDLF